MGNLALILRIAAPNGALVVQAARTAMQNPFGHPRVAPRLTLPRAPALGSLAAMPLIADRNGVIVVRLPRTAMQIQLGQQAVACPSLRINTRSLRPAPCVAIGVSLARVSFRRAVNTYSVLAYPLRICEFSCAPLYRIEERERFSCVQSCLAQSLPNTCIIAEQGRQLRLLLLDNPRRRNRCKKHSLRMAVYDAIYVECSWTRL